jgi:hypothetical protein
MYIGLQLAMADPAWQQMLFADYDNAVCSPNPAPGR